MRTHIIKTPAAHTPQHAGNQLLIITPDCFHYFRFSSSYPFVSVASLLVLLHETCTVHVLRSRAGSCGAHSVE